MKGKHYIVDQFLLYTILILFLVIFIYPFLWMLSTALKSDTEILGNPLSLPRVKYFYKDSGKEYEFIPYLKVQFNNGNIEFIDSNNIQKVSKPTFLFFKRTNYFYNGQQVKILKYEKPDIIKGKLIIQKRRRRYTKEMKIPYAKLKKKRFLFENFVRAMKEDKHFGIYFRNSLYTATVSTLLQLILAVGAAFAFARLTFPFKETIFTLFLATMMIPSQMLLIPNYIIISKMGLYNKLWGIMLPWLANVTNIFLLRQFFRSIPNDLFDSIRIDGGGMLHSIWHIALPLSKPILITTALFSFIFQWNSFIWVLIITNEPAKQTLQVGLANFSQAAGTDWNLLMAASTVVILPLIVLYFFVQRRIIESLSRSGLKG